jgi:hypothetical protein
VTTVGIADPKRGSVEETALCRWCEQDLYRRREGQWRHAKSDEIACDESDLADDLRPL